jgi:hypothetical protein
MSFGKFEGLWVRLLLASLVVLVAVGIEELELPNAGCSGRDFSPYDAVAEKFLGCANFAGGPPTAPTRSSNWFGI